MTQEKEDLTEKAREMLPVKEPSMSITMKVLKILGRPMNAMFKKIGQWGDFLLQKAEAKEKKHHISNSILLKGAGDALKSFSDGDVPPLGGFGFMLGTAITLVGVLTGSEAVFGHTVLSGAVVAATLPLDFAVGVAFGAGMEASAAGISAIPEAFANRHLGRERMALEKQLKAEETQKLAASAVSTMTAVDKLSAGANGAFQQPETAEKPKDVEESRLMRCRRMHRL